MFLFVSSVLLLPGSLARDARDRPNLIMLFVDDLGYGDTGFTGHPTAGSPNIDALAFGGKVLTTWYSGCAVCSGSRAALMTGRQFARLGVPGVYGPTVSAGLPLNETTIAEQLKKANYSTAIMGKWHLGQRARYLPGSRGFDYYLGIPYSDDMGQAVASTCKGAAEDAERPQSNEQSWMQELYEDAGYVDASIEDAADPAAKHLPLVYQEFNKTKIVEQPLDFTTLADKYNDFVTSYVEKHKEEPFFLYVPFSHVHTTSGNMPEEQYAGCAFQNTSRRGKFGDALLEVDWIVGNLVQKVREAGIEENTLFLFTGDNGPWMQKGLSGGSTGLLTGRHSGYWNTGKGSTWEGGIREAAFAYWKGQVQPFSRSAEVVSSMDVFPTISKLAGVPLPEGVVFDGRDMSEVLLEGGKSKHDFLFHYDGGTHCNGPSTVRHGKWKAHWCTRPGLGGCEGCTEKVYEDHLPLLFNVEKDPSESTPVDPSMSTEAAAALKEIVDALAMEKATFVHQENTPLPDGPGEGPGHYGVCCDRSKNCNCIDGILAGGGPGLLGIGSRRHHDKYHGVTGHAPPFPPTVEQLELIRRGS